MLIFTTDRGSSRCRYSLGSDRETHCPRTAGETDQQTDRYYNSCVSLLLRPQPLVFPSRPLTSLDYLTHVLISLQHRRYKQDHFTAICQSCALQRRFAYANIYVWPVQPVNKRLENIAHKREYGWVSTLDVVAPLHPAALVVLHIAK